MNDCSNSPNILYSLDTYYCLSRRSRTDMYACHDSDECHHILSSSAVNGVLCLQNRTRLKNSRELWP